MDMTRTEEMLVLLNRRVEAPKSTYTDECEDSATIHSGESTPLTHTAVQAPRPLHFAEKQAARPHTVRTPDHGTKADSDLRIVLGDSGGPATGARRLK